MDSNVSKNTFSHKFFKLGLKTEKTTISLKKILKQELLLSLDSAQQVAKIDLDPEFIPKILESKLTLARFGYDKISSKNRSEQNLSQLKQTPIVYACPIAFALAPYYSTSPQLVAENLINLLASKPNNFNVQSHLKLVIKVITPGWINFYFDSKAIANWLEQLFIFLNSQTAINIDFPLNQLFNSQYQLEKTPDNLFSVQYIYSRCCSLLRLGAREKLITLKDDSFSHLGWQLEQPQQISWLDEAQNFRFTQPAEYELLRQLMSVIDSLASDSGNWLQLALNWSRIIETYFAECRFLGVVKQQTPSKAIARLGLIALTQYWLQKLLVEKLHVAAPSTL